MPAWLIALGIKALESYGIPLAISILQKTGVINSVEAWGLKTGTHAIQVVSNTQVYDSPNVYPTGKNGQSDDPTSPSNINRVE